MDRSSNTSENDSPSEGRVIPGGVYYMCGIRCSNKSITANRCLIHGNNNKIRGEHNVIVGDGNKLFGNYNLVHGDLFHNMPNYLDEPRRNKIYTPFGDVFGINHATDGEKKLFDATTMLWTIPIAIDTFKAIDHLPLDWTPVFSLDPLSGERMSRREHDRRRTRGLLYNNRGTRASEPEGTLESEHQRVRMEHRGMSVSNPRDTLESELQRIQLEGEIQRIHEFEPGETLEELVPRAVSVTEPALDGALQRIHEFHATDYESRWNDAIKDSKRTRTVDLYYPSESDLKHDSKVENDGDKTCVICMTNVPCCIALPCAHMNFCVDCSRELCKGKKEVKCPLCKDTLDGIKYVFS